MKNWGKFILACAIVLAPLGLGMFVAMLKHKDFYIAGTIFLIICLMYCLIDAVISEVESKAKIKKLEAEITQLKEGNK